MEDEIHIHIHLLVSVKIHDRDDICPLFGHFGESSRMDTWQQLRMSEMARISACFQPKQNDRRERKTRAKS